MNNTPEERSYIRFGFHPTNTLPTIEILIDKKDNEGNKFSKIIFDLLYMIEETDFNLYPKRMGYASAQWCLYEFHSLHERTQDRLKEIVDKLNGTYLP